MNECVFIYRTKKFLTIFNFTCIVKGRKVSRSERYFTRILFRILYATGIRLFSVNKIKQNANLGALWHVIGWEQVNYH